MPSKDRELQAMLEGFASKGFTLAVQMLGNADDAADTVQEGLMVLWRNRMKLDNSHNPKAWFYRVMRNLCVDRLRRRIREKTSPVDLVELIDEASSDPAQIVEDDEYHSGLRRELDGMPEHMREILYLRDFHDLSYTEIAKVLNIPIGTVMSRLHRARMELHDRMLRGSDLQ